MITPNKSTRNPTLIFNWIFIPGLLALAVNDHYLKWQFGNWITGKLSDFAGLLIFPMFLQFLFPRLGRISVLLAGALFVFWKLPVSTQFIDSYNKIAIIPITRTVDYSDFIALSVLPLAQYAINRIDQFSISRISPGLATCLVAIPACFIFMATSPPLSFYMRPGGDIHIGKAYRLKMTKEQALAKLKANGFSIGPDTSQHELMRGDYYLMRNVVLDGGKDTIAYLQFGFLGNTEKPLLLINNVKLKGTNQIGALKALTKYYRRLIHAEIVEEVK